MDNGAGSGSWFRRLLDMPNDSTRKTVIVTLLVCLSGSVLVAGSAVLLKPAQIANQQREKQARFAEIIRGLPGDGNRIEARVVDLASGNYVETIEAARFDQRRAARDPERSVAIPAERDLAQIKRRSRWAVVHLVRNQGRLRLVILPVHGRGFGSTIYGYLGLTGDTQSVVGISFYEHGETPGLGALIDDPGWRDRWRGKKVWNDDGKPGLGVAEGPVDAATPEASRLVDGLTGATWTSRGVSNLLRFWLGEDGFGPFLRNIRDRRG